MTTIESTKKEIIVNNTSLNIMGQWYPTLATEPKQKVCYDKLQFNIGKIENYIQQSNDNKNFICKKTGVYKISLCCQTFGNTQNQRIEFKDSNNKILKELLLHCARDRCYYTQSVSFLINLTKDSEYFVWCDEAKVYGGAKCSHILIEFVN